MHPDAAAADSSSLRLPIDTRRLPWIRRLAADYSHAFDGLAPFFAGNPAEPAAWTAAIARAQAHPRNRDRIAEILSAQQERNGAPPEARAAARKLADSGTVAIVTGQQAGLFGGPLFTLLKAITALKLAERVSREHGVPAVAIFWIESEDHDWAEVASCSVLDADLHRRTIALGSPMGAGEVPVSSVHLDPTIFVAIEELGKAVQPTEFTGELVERLGAAYHPGAGMSEAFGRWMASVLGPLGLVLFDSADPAAKPLVADLFARELENPGVSSRLARETGEALVEHGYHAQVIPHEDSVALFRLGDTRQPIHFRDGSFLVGSSATPATDLAALARRQPEGFSPNVLLRPIVQDSLFPTIAYVAGPNELAYLAQLGPIYRQFGVPPPLFYPRASATILDSAAARFLARYHLDLEAIRPDDEATLNRLLESQLPVEVDAAREEATRAVESSMKRLSEAVGTIDPTLEGAARSSLGRMCHELETLHGKIIHAAKRRDETLRRQYARVRTQAYPDGEPQERSLGFVHFLNRYGSALVARLHAELPLDPGSHWVMTI